jgi:membrane-bound lytic murein transglycosylase D
VPASRRLTWRKHEVQRGETLSHIAATWGTSVRAIQEANSFGRRTLIHPGDQLLIPMPRELDDLARKRAAARGRYVPPAGHERVTYTVRSGDTLGAIARRLGVSVKHLKQVNGIKDPRRLRVGRTLAAYRPPRHS